MPASARGCAASAAAIATTTRPILKAIRVLADPRDEEPLVVERLGDRHDVNDQNREPEARREQAEETAEAACRHADDARDESPADPQDDLGDHEDDPVLGVPLDVRVLLLDEQRDDGQDPE